MVASYVVFSIVRLVHEDINAKKRILLQSLPHVHNAVTA